MSRLVWVSAVPFLCCVFLFRVADANPDTESMSLNRPPASFVQTDSSTKPNLPTQATTTTAKITTTTTHALNTAAHTTNTTTHAPNTTAHTTNTTTHAPTTTAHTTNTTTHAPNTTAHTTNTTTHALNTTAHTTNTTTHAPNTTAHTTNTTTHAPTTTAHTTNTTTHAPNTTAHTTYTTTHAPTTTAHTTNTTTHALNTTTSSYTTQPTPTLAPNPSPPTAGIYTVKDIKNVICIKALVGLELQLYNSSKVKGYYNIIPNETTTDGTCGDSTANLKVSFPGGFINFGFVTDQGYYYIKDIDVLLKLASETWNVSTTNEKLLYTKRGNSVTCKNTPTTKIKDSVGVVMANVKLQAFDFTSGEFGKEQRCSYENNVIAVAIGVTVAVIVIIGILYLIWRKKKASGYERI
uniref:Lysosomal associated membrane protein 3 n=1 Tax=Leptobrachium leishanense TaxID=445787 RepID=A0A8C5M1X4_9ANUR